MLEEIKFPHAFAIAFNMQISKLDGKRPMILPPIGTKSYQAVSLIIEELVPPIIPGPLGARLFRLSFNRSEWRRHESDRYFSFTILRLKVGEDSDSHYIMDAMYTAQYDDESPIELIHFTEDWRIVIEGSTYKSCMEAAGKLMDSLASRLMFG